MKKRIAALLCVVLIICMILSVLPVASLAAEAGPDSGAEGWIDRAVEFWERNMKNE